MKFWVKIEGQERQVTVVERNDSYDIEIDGKFCSVDCRHFGHKDYLSLLIDNKSYLIESAPVKVDEGKYYARVFGHRYDVEVLDERLVAVRDVAGSQKTTGNYVVASPMPGLIIDVRVKVGDTVKAGSPVAVIEAMKMQNELVSEVDGVVKAVKVQPKDTVESQAALIEIERT